MAHVDQLSSPRLWPVALGDKEQNSVGDRSLSYLLVFAAAGFILSALSLALTRAEWLPEATAASNSEMASAGLNVSEIEIPAGLQLTHYSTH
jgi:hypothetical protein